MDMMNYQELAEQIHRNKELIVVDAHLDLLIDLYNKHQQGMENVIIESHLDNFRAGGVNVIIAALFIDTKDLPEAALKQALGQIAAFYKELESGADKYVSLCRSYQDIERAISEGKVAILLSFEGAEPLGDNPDLLRLFYELGLRGLGLCWSRKNMAADGALYAEVEQGQKAGLSNLGYRIVREAERLGIFIDVSHLGDEGFEDLKKIAGRPFIASHSNCRALHKMERSLSDEQIRDIASRGGVIGVNACSALITMKEEGSTIADFVAHVKHLVKHAGIEHVGLGFDFSGGIMPDGSKLTVDGKNIPIFDVVKGYAGIHELTVELLKEGFSEEDIRLIYGGNFMKLFSEIL